MFKEIISCITFAFTCMTVNAQFVELPTERENSTMNFVANPVAGSKIAILVVGGTSGPDGRIMIKSRIAPPLSYLGKNIGLFTLSGISLVATGCPTDQWARFGMCQDAYRKSQEYVDDMKKVISYLKTQYGFEKFYLFGHSSGGISSRWLSVNMPEDFSGVINSSVMTGTAGNLAHSTVGFDMSRIKIPVLNIAHKDDQCPSTPYYTVKSYSKDNLVTVKGGDPSGPLCEGVNYHSFEGRQRGVTRAIVKWITTGEVTTVVDDNN